MATSKRSSAESLQRTFGLTEEEYCQLRGESTEAAARFIQLCELSVILVGHMNREEIAEYLTTPQVSGAVIDDRFFGERIPIDVAKEPGGLRRVVNDARRAVAANIAARDEVAAPVPEAKRG